MPEFIVSIPVHFQLEKVIKARDEEEARRIAENLNPEDFENFDTFYEYLGDMWKSRKIVVKKLSPAIEILDWWVEEETVCYDRVTNTNYGKKAIAGKFRAFGVEGEFRVEEEWGEGCGATAIHVTGKFSEDEKETIKEYIEEWLRDQE